MADGFSTVAGLQCHVCAPPFNGKLSGNLRLAAKLLPGQTGWRSIECNQRHGKRMIVLDYEAQWLMVSMSCSF